MKVCERGWCQIIENLKYWVRTVDFFSFHGLNIVPLSVCVDYSLHTQRGSASSLGLLPGGIS